MMKRFHCLFLLLLAWTSADARPPAIVVVGDSLSAGFGVPLDQGWVDLLARRLAEQGHPHQVVNASVTGDTTRGGLARLPALLERENPQILIIELGGNDGLRGITPQVMADNLRQMITLAREAGSDVLLLGVELPGNYGPTFRDLFKDVYYEVSHSEQVPLVSSFITGVALNPELMQSDGIHPNAAAQPVLLDEVWPALEPMLEAASAAR